MGDYSLTGSHERTKSNANGRARKLSGLRCDFPVAPYSRRNITRTASARAAQHFSPESSYVPTRQPEPPSALPRLHHDARGSSSERRATQVGWAHVHVPVIRTRSPRARLFRRRDLSGSPEPGLSRDARGRGGRGACGSSCSLHHGTLARHLVLTSSQQYLTPASGPTYKVAPTHRALNTHKTHP